MKWETVTLGEISKSIQTGPFGSQLHQTDYSEQGTPVVMPKDLVNGHISEDSIARVEQSHVERLCRHIIEEGDILYSRRGDVGRCAFATALERGWLCGTGCLRVTVDERKALPKFVFYQLQRAESVGWVENHAVGSTMLNLNTSILSAVPVTIPEIPTQKRIVAILSSYDNLIENNQKQIKLLEEAAQRLYQEWFVKLRFPGHEKVKFVDGVPEGWKSCSLGDVIDINPKISVKKGHKKISVPMSALSTTLMVIDRTQFTQTMSNAGSKFQNGDTLLARITPCLQNGKTGFVWGLDPEEVAVGSTEFIVMRSKNLNPYIVYLLARTDDFREYAIKSMTGSDGRQRAQTSKIELFPYCLPSVEIINQFSDFVAPIFQSIFSLNCQCEKLAEARDRLIPKLMSGEIEV